MIYNIKIGGVIQKCWAWFQHKFGRWLVVGLGIKRWLLLLGVGASIAGMGVVYLILILRRIGLLPTPLYQLITFQVLPIWARVLIPLVIGGGVILWSINRLSQTVLSPYRQPGDKLIDRLYIHRKRQQGPHIVAIGGGTGLSTLLRGLRNHTNNITAIVTMGDDGGSSGRLRTELGIPPPGDLRNNMAALAQDEALMAELLQYRFGGGISGSGSLSGHSFGNLLLAALTEMTGSFDQALLAAERVLALQGRVMPATLQSVRLVADVRFPEQDTIQRVEGESAIPKVAGKIERLYLEPENVPAYMPALDAIAKADLIVLGPGSLYTSVLPNLLIKELAEAVQKASAPKVYVCNLATQLGETDNYTVAQHVTALKKVIPNDTVDIILANSNLSLPSDKVQYVQLTDLPQEKLIMADLLDEQQLGHHHSGKLATEIMKLLERS